MKRSDFYYDLPPELIAQTPLAQRDASRLLVLDKANGQLSHRSFTDLPELLNPGDLLVLNNSRVLPARLYGRKQDTGALLEMVLLEQKNQTRWEVLVRPGKKAKPGTVFVFGDGLLEGEIVEILEGGNRLVEFHWQSGSFFSLLEQLGEMPLPPYITEKLQDKERYQTVYAQQLGSAAAPTAGLHFTPALLQRLEQRGIGIAYLTLHVGLGTFRPVKADDIADHKMHAEHFAFPQETAEAIAQTKARGGRVVAVGTTSCRTLESLGSTGIQAAAEGYTDIFIYPGYEFSVIDGLLTNFHLPESTLIMLVSALAGREVVLQAYHTAVEQRYRFFSFGDAMLIL